MTTKLEMAGAYWSVHYWTTFSFFAASLTFLLQGGPNITANLYCICLSENETFAYADGVQICGNIWNAHYIWELAMVKEQVMNTFKVGSIEEDVQMNKEDIIDLR